MITSETRGASMPARSQRGFDRDAAEFVRREICECPVECPDRGARRANDDDIVLHHKTPC